MSDFRRSISIPILALGELSLMMNMAWLSLATSHSDAWKQDTLVSGPSMALSISTSMKRRKARSVAKLIAMRLIRTCSSALLGLGGVFYE